MRYNVFYCGFFRFQAKHWNQVRRYLRKVGIDFASVQKVTKRQDIERKGMKRMCLGYPCGSSGLCKNCVENPNNRGKKK